MNAVAKRRLLKLADRLDTVPPKRFNMSTWGDADFKERTCGTAACACGWATTIPSFRRAGLRLAVLHETDRHAALAYEGHEDEEAAAAFFRITQDEAEGLFLPDAYEQGIPTPKAVAKRIRRFVKASV